MPFGGRIEIIAFLGFFGRFLVWAKPLIAKFGFLNEILNGEVLATNSRIAHLSTYISLLASL